MKAHDYAKQALSKFVNLLLQHLPWIFWAFAVPALMLGWARLGQSGLLA